MKLGRNDPCPCGSGLKFKKCGLVKGHGGEARPSFETLHDRNIQIIDAIHEAFGPIGKNILELKTHVTADRVRAFYRIVNALSPADMDPYSLLAQHGGAGLRALYTGDARPELLAQNVFRFTLYTDQILMVEPFMAPAIMREKYNPMKHPEQYRSDTLRLAFLTLALEPWIRLGLVQFIPDPTDFDLKLKSFFLDEARKRYEGEGALAEEDLARDFERALPLFKRDFVRTMESLPRGALERKLARDGVDPDSIPGMVDYMKGRLRTDPLAIEDPDLEKGELMIRRSAGNLESTLYITEMTGAFPYTDGNVRWRELLKATEDASEVTRLWTPLTRAFAELPFQFLNAVDPDFAFRMREEDRLLQLRTFIRRIWNSMAESPDASTMEGKARVFSEELRSEYQSVKADWKAIEDEYNNSTINDAWLAGLAAFGGALTPGHIGVGLSIIGFGISSYLRLKRLENKIEQFKHTVPMSVFVDLDTSHLAPF